MADADWPATIDAAALLAAVRRLHHRPQDFDDGDLERRLWRHDRYDLVTLPTARLTTPFAIHGDLVAEYAALVASGSPLPPIVWHARRREPVDGGHRIEAARAAGLATVRAYVGRPKPRDARP